MAGISKIVDERIDFIKKERAALDSLRQSLEAKEAELAQRESYSDDGMIKFLEEKKNALKNEIEEASLTLEKLNNDKNSRLKDFGDKIEDIHTGKIIEIEQTVNSLQRNIDMLNKKKAGVENDIKSLEAELSDLKRKKEADLKRYQSEKEAFVSRLSSEKEDEIEALNLKFSEIFASLDQLKRDKEAEIEGLNRELSIERGKNASELARIKTIQLSELESSRESMLAKIEEEKSEMLSELREARKNKHSELTSIEQLHEKKIAELEQKKQRLSDDIQELSYEFEKAKAENILKLETLRDEELRAIEVVKESEIAKYEGKKEKVLAEIEHKKTIDTNKYNEEKRKFEKDLLELELAKSNAINEINLLTSKLAMMKTDNEVEIERIRSVKLNEVDEIRLKRLKELEELRQQRMFELEASFLQRANALELIRNEKFEECRKSIDEAVFELESLKNTRQEIINEIELLRTETEKAKREKETMLKSAVLNTELEMEKLKAEKIDEIEKICAQKLKRAEEIETSKMTELNESEKRYNENLEALKEEINNLTQSLEVLKPEFERQHEQQMAEIEKIKIESMDEFSKLKLSKLKEIEEYLENYREEKLKGIQTELENQINHNYVSLAELKKLNAEYNKRENELNELAITLEADKRSFYLKEKLFNEEQKDFKNTFQNEMEVQKKELNLILQSKNHQIQLMQEKLKEYANEIEEYKNDILSHGAKPKQELIKDVEFLNARIDGLQQELSNKPSASYIISLEEKIKGYDDLERENKKLAIKIAGLEKERHNWQITVNEINRLNEEKIMLEERLAMKKD